MIGQREISYATDSDYPPGTVWRWKSIVTTVKSLAPVGGSADNVWPDAIDLPSTRPIDLTPVVKWLLAENMRQASRPAGS